ncbi:AMP-binding protein [Burkholderia diffusa]|uniref:AMP-binding protein n=1 Tax=Burkholderia diffusa TaxID=488732 RepID=UPI0009BF09F0|nr:AMP-binding protein [Burkholderia diffusa]
MLGRARFGDPAAAVWHPTQENIARSRLAAAMQRWGFSSLSAFHAASVDKPDWFWPAAAEDLGVRLEGEARSVRDEAGGRAFPRWFDGATFNAVWGCVDRHAGDSARSAQLAVVYEGDSGQRRTLTYAELQQQVDACAAELRRLGVGKGDRVAIFMPPLPEAAVAMLGCAKIGAVAVPAFSGYGSESLATRLQASEASVLVTVDGTTRRGKPVAMKSIADGAVAASPSVRSVLVVRSSGHDVAMTEGRDFWWGTVPALPREDIDRLTATEALDPNDPLLIIYTSGTTGAPKGIVHSQLGYVLKAAIDFGYAFDIQHDDVIGWIADMGWNLGPLMVFGGLHFGATIVLVEGVPDYPESDRLWRIAERNRVTLQGIAPTAARGLRARSDGAKPAADLSSLRAFASTGEAWDEPSWHWLFESVGQSKLPILNYTGGTEVGGGILSGYTIAPQSPASFSGPLPGMDVDVFDADGKPTSGIGELVILNTWPGMAHGFWHENERYLKTYWSRWSDVWVHGDLANIDKDGYWHICGRSDDTLKIGGRRVGPAEIESALVAQPGVAEAAVIGAPDEVKGQRVVAFVVARPGADVPTESRLIESVIALIGKGLAPSRIHVVSGLPKTKNGKIMRRAIRARYVGEPIGDLSALDPLTPLETIPEQP